MVLEPKPAATVVVARDADEGFEVLLLQRTHSAVFMPGVFVFPGGAVDEGDYDPALTRLAKGTDDARASDLLGLPRGGLAYLIAAIRECFEESGLLLARTADDRPVSQEAGWDLEAMRRRLADGSANLAELCLGHDLRLQTGGIGYLAHWVTPPGPPRRYDTRFLVAAAPPGQTACHDGSETIDHAWISPGRALELNRRGEFPLGSPTLRTLRTLEQFASTDELLEHGRRRRQAAPAPALPAQGRDGPRRISPGEPAYAELAKRRAEGLGEGSYELIPGILERLSARVRRLVAPNPGVMTGPGTNTYLLGDESGVAVIDPGPDIESHVAAIAEAGAPVRWILATHTHRDHSPATRRLQRLTDAPILGMPPPPGPSQDQDFAPDRVLDHGERLRVAPGTTLRVIHTPGHASNHLCFLLEEERLLFSGDHIMQGSTVVISPPDGHMGAYLRSLAALHEEPIEYIAPGHGFLLGEPQHVIERIHSHRMAREAKVMEALRQWNGADEQTLVRHVYDDVPEAMHRVAGRSLLAHLIKLRDDGVARQEGDAWYTTA